MYGNGSDKYIFRGPDPDEIEGLDDIITALDALPRKLASKILFESNKTILEDVARKPLVNTLSHLSRASKKGIKVRKAKGTGGTGAYVGVTTDAYWLRFVNFGTQERKIKSKDKYERRISERYYKIGRRGRVRTANRGRILGDNRISSFLDSRSERILKVVQEHYGELVNQVIIDNIKKARIRKAS